MTLAELTALWREPNAIEKLAELGQGDKDKLHRIHGTNEPWTIGTNVSSGCIRLTNDDIRFL